MKESHQMAQVQAYLPVSCDETNLLHKKVGCITTYVWREALIGWRKWGRPLNSAVMWMLYAGKGLVGCAWPTEEVHNGCVHVEQRLQGVACGSNKCGDSHYCWRVHQALWFSSRIVQWEEVLSPAGPSVQDRMEWLYLMAVVRFLEHVHGGESYIWSYCVA